MQWDGPAVHFSIFQRDDAVKGMVIVTDAAGIQEQRFAPHIHERAVGVAKEKQVQILLLGRISGS